MEAKRQIVKSKRDYYGSSWNQLIPEVVLYVGLPSLNIPRIVRDYRTGEYVLPEDRLPRGVNSWTAKVDGYYGFYLGSCLADGEQEAKKIFLHEVINNEVERIHDHRPLQIVSRESAEIYEEKFREWQECGMPVYEKEVGYPEVTDMAELLDPRARWHDEIKR